MIKHKTVKISGKMPPFLTWHISKIIVDFLSLVVNVCFLNQSNNHWLFFDALQFAIIMCLKFREKITNPFVPIHLIYDDS